MSSRKSKKTGHEGHDYPAEAETIAVDFFALMRRYIGDEGLAAIVARVAVDIPLLAPGMLDIAMKASTQQRHEDTHIEAWESELGGLV